MAERVEREWLPLRNLQSLSVLLFEGRFLNVAAPGCFREDPVVATGRLTRIQ
jgi:hypothetical protein